LFDGSVNVRLPAQAAGPAGTRPEANGREAVDPETSAPETSAPETSDAETGGSGTNVGGAGRAEAGSVDWWGERAEASGRRRPRAGGLSVERLVDAAMDVLRSGGLEALTVRAVAERLGTSSASLYRHIASRDELIVLLLDHCLGDVRPRRTGRGWRADVEQLMREIRRVMLEQPLPPSVGLSRPAWGPNTLRINDAALSLFLEAGLTEEQAAYATTAMMAFLAGATAIQRSNTGRGPSGVAGTSRFDEFLDGLPADELPGLRTAGAALMAASTDDVFTQGMALFLDGITCRFLDRG